MPEKSYYEILGVSKNADANELKGVYRKLVLKYHPDKLPDEKKEWGEEMIKEINEAYSVLTDPKKREVYDRFGKEGLEGMSGPGGMGPFNMPDLSDLMNEILRGGGSFGGPFGGSFGGPFGSHGHGPGHEHGHRKEKVPPVECHENMTLDEIYTGKEVEKDIERYNLCKKCDATGSADKKNYKCEACNGKGVQVVRMQIGPNVIQQGQRHCSECKGSGNGSNYKQCSDCKGKRVILSKYKLKFKIEPGVKHNDMIAIKGQGHELLPENKNGNKSRGDIVVVIEEQEHDTFKRGVVIQGKMDPSNILMTMEISLAEALCGFSRSIDHLNGDKLFINSINVIEDGDIKFLADSGLPNKKGQYGRLFITFKIEYPSSVSHGNKKILYEVLTGKSFDEVDNTIPSNHKFKHLENVDLNGGSYYDSSDGESGSDSDDEFHGNPMQCAQQ